MRISDGKPYPLGATWDGKGVNFALFSATAKNVELCLFESHDQAAESERIQMPSQTDEVWHVYIKDIRPGQLYGYRVHGPYDPKKGLRFNANKVLLDPYAKAIGRRLTWDNSLFGYQMNHPEADLSLSETDNARFAPLAAVVDPAFTWGDDKRPDVPWHETVIYEAHVKGATQRHPEVPEKLRGTYAGLASEPMLKHFRDLGVTSIELMPIHHTLNDKVFVDKGLNNYWGYNTLSFFAPDIRFGEQRAGDSHVDEFKMMVRALHAAGFEVILDVVYNHTAEGNQLGPTLSWRGIDNTSYYNLSDKDPRYYIDFTGCGNGFNMRHPRVLQMIMDSLRYWVTEMHVDGFRFDLASALARELYEVNKLGVFFDVIHQDPIISQVKLIAEPWDLGPGGYQVGNFPSLWTEWNGRYRDCIRRFWKGDGGLLPEMATRFTGSSDLYEHTGKRPYASINFVTAHDGFCLQDLVSYNEKHNEANGENNKDGDSHNDSWNCGVEGPTDDPKVVQLRERQKRNLLATLFFSAGVPMMLGGDELSHTKQGNNNTYCQDNELNWYNWELNDLQEKFLEEVQKMIRIRRKNPTLQRRKFFSGLENPDIVWYGRDGKEMTERGWHDPASKIMGVCILPQPALSDADEEEKKEPGRTLLVLMNSYWEDMEFILPPGKADAGWTVIYNTAENERQGQTFTPKKPIIVRGRSVCVMRLGSDEEADPKR